MSLVTGWSRRTPLALVALLAGCATAGTSPRPAATAAVDAGPPAISVTVLPFTRGRWVDATFHVSDNAYAMVLEMDLDRNVRVLYPESPSDLAPAKGGERHAFTAFFAGFGGTSFGGASRYRSALYDASFNRITPFEGGGVLIGIASDRPLQLDRLAQDGDWNEEALQELLYDRTVPEGVRAIGRLLTVDGQEFSSDYQSFRQAPQSLALFAFNSGNCLDFTYDDFGYASAYDRAGYLTGLPSRVPVARYVVGNQVIVRYAQRDGCGHTTYIDVPQFIRPPSTPPMHPDSLPTAPATNALRWGGQRNASITPADDEWRGQRAAPARNTPARDDADRARARERNYDRERAQARQRPDRDAAPVRPAPSSPPPAAPAPGNASSRAPRGN